MVIERTGHHSTFVRSYKCTSGNQMRGLSDILYGDLTRSFVPPVQQSDVECDSVNVKKPRIDDDTKGKSEVSAEVNYNQQNTVSVSSGDTKSISFNFTVNINK